MTGKPWDARIANILIHPLENSRVSPNHLTSLGLLLGLSAAAAYAVGGDTWPKWAAFLFVLSSFLDHADGELARLTGKTSLSGHYYDLVSDASVQILLFVGIGYGLRNTDLGEWALPMGIVAGVSIATIFWLRMSIENRLGKAAIEQPSFAGFEIQDVLYILVPVTWLGWLAPFLTAAVIGAPAFALWTLREYRKVSSAIPSKGNPS